MLDFVGREIGKLIYGPADLEDFVMRNLHHVDRRPPPSGYSFSQIDSEYILDVTTRLTEYPYFLVAHYDDERRTMRLMYIEPSEITEPTAYQRHCNALYNVETMEPWLTRIKEEALRGESEVTFKDVDDQVNDNHYNLNNKQAHWLRNQGFRVDWEKYPREWTVKGIA